MEFPPTLGLVINTYDQPEYLSRVLQAVARQTALPHEVVLADDGSGAATRDLFREWTGRQRFRCQHSWQPHEGFRRSRILNAAIAKLEAQWVVFLDGDTVPHPRFVDDHRHLAAEGVFVQGHRALVEEKAAPWFGLGAFKADRRRALLSGQLSGVKHAFRWPVPLRRVRGDLRGIRGCNLAVARGDLVQVNGYNEAFTGWGREDSELAVRLMNAGVRRMDVRGRCLCYHLWHPPVSRAQLADNDQRLTEAQQQGAKQCERGLADHQAASR